MTRSPVVGFQYGELILALRAGGSRSLFQLRKGARFANGISHSDLEARGSAYVQTDAVTFRRPTLDEYVVLMDRVPAPTYPKDAQTMVAMMDIGEGSRVLEAGTGSGGLTLQLSKNVGKTGQVYSFESSTHHMRASVRNYRHWRDNWELVHGGGGGGGERGWPDNVLFVEADVSSADSHVTSEVDAVALDLMDPGPLLTFLLPILKPSGLLSVYLPNITQHIHLLEHIRTGQLPLELEKVVEVTHTEWTVKQAASKNPRRLAGMEQVEDGLPKYICRPSHKQLPHTAFLGLLRKVPSGCQPQ